jgi:hypothetical protein
LQKKNFIFEKNKTKKIRVEKHKSAKNAYGKAEKHALHTQKKQR